MKYAYVLPDPAAYRELSEFEGDLLCMREAGYSAAELQIADPSEFDERRARSALDAAGLPLCAIQTGLTYASRGNCLSAAGKAIRRRTTDLLLCFVDLAARFDALLVFGSLQGRLSDEPDRSVGASRIVEAVREVAAYATECAVTVAFEPVQHGEVGFHNTIDEVARVVRGIGLPGLRMMVDTFHMNIEERDMLAPLAGIADILAHVHLCETNRDVLGAGHWPTAAFLSELARIGFQGACSVGVYTTRLSRRECMARCMARIRACREAV